MRRQQLLFIGILHVLASHISGVCAQSGGPLALASPLGEATLQVPVATSVDMVFNDGRLQPTWSSWSWGLSYINTNDASSPAPGSSASLCVELQPYGALSLRTTQPFAVDLAMLGMHVRGNTNATGSAQDRQQQLAQLEVQLETGRDGSYQVSRSASLRDLLVRQAAEDGSDAEAQLQAMAAGQWVPLRMRLSDFVAGSGEYYDRITLGKCLQNMDACAGDVPNTGLCLDHLVLVAAV